MPPLASDPSPASSRASHEVEVRLILAYHLRLVGCCLSLLNRIDGPNDDLSGIADDILRLSLGNCGPS